VRHKFSEVFIQGKLSKTFLTCFIPVFVSRSYGLLKSASQRNESVETFGLDFCHYWTKVEAEYLCLPNGR